MTPVIAPLPQFGRHSYFPLHRKGGVRVACRRLNSHLPIFANFTVEKCLFKIKAKEQGSSDSSPRQAAASARGSGRRERVHKFSRKTNKNV